MISAEDHLAVLDLFARYCRGIDRLDTALLKSVYWPDSADHHGVFDGPGQEFAEWIVPFLRDKYTHTLHLLGQSLISCSGDSISAETYFSSMHGLDRNGVASVEMCSGRYLDRLERRSGIWRVLDRLLVIDFIFEVPGGGAAASLPPAFARGERAKSDVSYRLF
jgi:hypothetical protein